MHQGVELNDHAAAGLNYAEHFSATLLHPGKEPPTSIASSGNGGTTKRYNVYRNNVVVSLIEALAATFPATARITGPDFFRAMARFHIRETPPTSPLLFEYGRDFPDFIECYDYARPMPWLADVARIERAWLDAYHAADADAVSVSALAAIPGDELDDIAFASHPATRVIRSRYPAVTIFAANKADGPVGQITTTEAEDALVTRSGLNVVVLQLPPGGATFLSCLISGDTLGVASARALADCPDFDLAANIVGLLGAGAFSHIVQRDGRHVL